MNDQETPREDYSHKKEPVPTIRVFTEDRKALKIVIKHNTGMHVFLLPAFVFDSLRAVEGFGVIMTDAIDSEMGQILEVPRKEPSLQHGMVQVVQKLMKKAGDMRHKKLKKLNNEGLQRVAFVIADLDEMANRILKPFFEDCNVAIGVSFKLDTMWGMWDKESE